MSPIPTITMPIIVDVFNIILLFTVAPDEAMISRG
jgi:hypothetical protein